MTQLSQLLDLSHVSIEQIEITQGLITLSLAMETTEADCPICGTPAHRVHSRYERTLQDLSCAGTGNASAQRRPAASMERSIQAGNAVIASFPHTTFGVHICRGNRRSYWLREGTYDAIAEQLFNRLNHHRFLLEYDTERAGTFAPLRFVPKDKIVVLGLITTKTGRIETPDELLRRIEEASRYISIDQLALSPQCGFASEIGGNLLSEEDQWHKLEVMLVTAEQVWGRAAKHNA